MEKLGGRNNNRNQRESVSSRPQNENLPFGRVPDYQLWQPRVDSTGREVGFTSPDGAFHPLSKGEKMQVRIDRPANRFDVVITNSIGSTRIIHSGPLAHSDLDPELSSAHPGEVDTGISEHVPTGTPEGAQPAHTEQTEESKFNLNKERLNELIETASMKGARFGFELKLTDEDRASILKIADHIENRILEQINADLKWREFKNLETDLHSKGFLGSGVFPPSWLINGGPTARVEATYLTGHRTTITVPEYIYNAYYWLGRAEDLRLSASMHSGENAKYFAVELRDAVHFLSQVTV